MLTVAYAEDSRLTDYYEAVIDKSGIPIVIDGSPDGITILHLRLLTASSEGEMVYTEEPVFEIDAPDKPLIATLEISGTLPRYGILSNGKTYAVTWRNDSKTLKLKEVMVVPLHITREK